MKGLLLMLLAGTGLFVGTTVGLLALQGRLDWAGTQGVPVLESMFDAPTGEEEHASGDGTPSHDPGAAASEHDRLPGSSGGEQLGHAGPSPDAIPATAASPPPAPGGGAAVRGADETRADPAAVEHAPSRVGQDQHRRGRLFEFPLLDSGLSAQELDRILVSVRELEASVKRKEAALAQREAETSARADDIEERSRAVQQLMRDVLQAREKLKEDTEAFEKAYTLVKNGEAARFRDYAERLAALGAKKCAEMVRSWWKREEDRANAVKILRLMPREPLDELLAVLETDVAKEILDRLADTALEGVQE